MQKTIEMAKTVAKGNQMILDSLFKKEEKDENKSLADEK